jgi:hypothetical protein
VKWDSPQIFFYYNYSNNPNFNNKSDKIKNLRIRMPARHCQWRVAKMPPTVTSFLFSFFLKKKPWKMLVGVAFFPLASGPTQTLSFRKKNMKGATGSGVFAQTRQWEWRVYTAPLAVACCHSYS